MEFCFEQENNTIVFRLFRRYGVVGERFVWEGGSRAAPYQGVYAVMYSVPQLLAQALDFAVRGVIDRMTDLGRTYFSQISATILLKSEIPDFKCDVK